MGRIGVLPYYQEAGQTSMTGRERLLAAFQRLPVDRAPIWLREGFPILEGPAEADNFGNGWQAAPLYRELFESVAPHADVIQGWGIPCMNRDLLVPPGNYRNETIVETDTVHQYRRIVSTPGGELDGVTEHRRHQVTGWHVKRMVESEEDLEKLASVPFDIDPERIRRARENYTRARKLVGDRGVTRMGISSPMVCISGCMSLELFLELSITRKQRLLELCELVTERTLAILDALFAEGPLDTTVNLGGSEQCTPPMMAPEGYDEFVVPYDGRIIRWCKDRNLLVNVHCHGKVRHALQCMVDMGVDASDPVEPPPQGDVTYAEARDIAGDDLTLVGNLQFSDLETWEPEQVRARVKEILSQGNRRLILAASAGPIEPITPRLADNYRAWVDTALAFGACQSSS